MDHGGDAHAGGYVFLDGHMGMEEHQARQAPSGHLCRRNVCCGVGVSSLPGYDVTDGSCIAECTVQRDHRCWVDGWLNSRCYADVCSVNGQACQPSVAR